MGFETKYDKISKKVFNRGFIYDGTGFRRFSY